LFWAIKTEQEQHYLRPLIKNFKLQEADMRSFRLSYWPGFLLLISVLGGLLTGCASPALENAQPEETTHIEPTEVPTMIPTEAAQADAPETGNSTIPGPESKVAHSAKVRDTNPVLEECQLTALAAGNNAFAADLYQALQNGGSNLFFSPYSISLALAMTYGGARGDTAEEMAETLHLTLPEAGVHNGFNALDLALASRNNEGDEMMPGFKLNVANSAWVQYDRPFEQAYLDLLAESYDAGLYLTDYVKDSEGSRLAINDWVSEETEGKIEDLIPQGAINALTRLVLANAVYFNAGWQNTFDEDLTEEGDFTLLDGSQVTVPMMATSDPQPFGYAAGEDYQAVELPYNGGQLSMVIVVPEVGQFEPFEAGLDSDKLTDLLDALETKQVELKMPKFSFESEFGLVSVLRQLGMGSAFDPQSADSSGIDGSRDLFISDVIHKAFVSVDEEGTEAAAATAVVFRMTSLPVTDVQMTIDSPFIFLIRDKPTGTLLFLGRVIDPTQ
jgi:serpin B